MMEGNGQMQNILFTESKRRYKRFPVQKVTVKILDDNCVIDAQLTNVSLSGFCMVNASKDFCTQEKTYSVIVEDSGVAYALRATPCWQTPSHEKTQMGFRFSDVPLRWLDYFTTRYPNFVEVVLGTH